MKGSQKNFGNDLKIIVVGNSGTGKTSFVNKWTKNTFTDNYKATIVSEFGYKIINHNGKFYRIQIWDLAGIKSLIIAQVRIKIPVSQKFSAKMHMV